MALGSTLTVGFVDDNGDWTAVTETNPLPISSGGAPAPDVAGLNTFGFVQGIFIENGGTLPPDLPTYALVIEQE